MVHAWGSYGRGDVIVFETPPAARAKCGAGGTFVKRIIGLPGERVGIRLRRGAAYVYIDGRRLEEPYIENDRRDILAAPADLVPLVRSSSPTDPLTAVPPLSGS